jgi:hypothetical protein
VEKLVAGTANPITGELPPRNWLCQENRSSLTSEEYTGPGCSPPATWLQECSAFPGEDEARIPERNGVTHCNWLRKLKQIHSLPGTASTFHYETNGRSKLKRAWNTPDALARSLKSMSRDYFSNYADSRDCLDPHFLRPG